MHLYLTTNDFLIDNKTDAAVVIHSSGESYMVTRGMSDPQTGKKLKGIGAPWVIKRGSDYYFNMIYSNDIMSGIYVKLDIVGRYCVSVLDKNTYGKVKGNSVNLYGMGALGILASNSVTWNKSLKDSTDSKRYIVFIDTKEIEPRDSPKNEGSRANLLGRKKVAEMMQHNNRDGSPKEMSFEEVIELIKIENAKSD